MDNQEPKYCPLILMNQGYHREIEHFCVRQACEWWVDVTNCCCIKTLAVIPPIVKPTSKPPAATKKGK